MGPDDEQLWLWRMERLDERERQEEAEPWEGTPVPSGEAAPGPQEVPPPADNEPPRIEPALRVMQAEQVKRVLRRYAPRGRATRKHDMIVEISATLGSPQRLDAVIQGLSPLERALLEELARRGGIADGWELVTFAVLQGHEPPEKHERDLAYGRAIGRSRAARFLAGPIRDGLLIPSDTAAAWFDFGYGGTWSDRVHADARLLARLAPREVPAPAVLPLDAVADPRLEARHPAAVVLETFDVLQLVADEGGLNVTRRGTIAKPFLRRLEKARPHLWDRLEIQLRTLAALGLVRPPSDDTVQQPWSVDTDAVAHLRRLPLFKLYAVFVDASCEVRDPNVDRTWIHEPGGGHDPRPFWRAMLDALPTLPDAPAAVDAAARGLWAGTLEPVFGRAPFPGQPPSPATSVPGAVREMLLGPLPHLALLAAGEARTPTASPSRQSHPRGVPVGTRGPGRWHASTPPATRPRSPGRNRYGRARVPRRNRTCWCSRTSRCWPTWTG